MSIESVVSAVAVMLVYVGYRRIMRSRRAKMDAERKRIAKEREEAERVRRAKEAERERIAMERAETERAEAERARRAKEIEERRLALHGNLVAEAVTNDLAKIRKCYLEGQPFLNPFLGKKGRSQDEKQDWLARWASPRLPLTKADAQAGEALLSEFGTKYLPNAYANYEKRREGLADFQQAFNEELPQPWTFGWDSVSKVLERFARARMESFICHDELCHYWLLWRLDVLSGKDFAAIDAKRLSVWLLPEDIECTKPALSPLTSLKGKVADFVAKYAPASSGLYQEMAREFKELDALLAEVGEQRRQMDDVRHSRALMVAVDKRNDIARELNELSLQLRTWHMDYLAEEKSADDMARCDADMVKKLKPFIDSLPTYVKERVLGPVIASSELVAIPGPGNGYHLQRTEVTQRQWEAVMGSNPSTFRGPDRPVEGVSWNDCQEFIKLVSAMDGLQYRLPTVKEWKYACRAGSKDDWGKRANGACGPRDVMGWYKENSGGETHPVAQKEPNAWGLYDMHGNVWEWCQDGYNEDDHVLKGGSWSNEEEDCDACSRGSGDPDARYNNCGFRLAGPRVPVIAASELVAIPGRKYRLQRTQVTQRQWETVMWNNPSRFKGPDRPVERVSWGDCQEFIKLASALDGRQYRLPTEEEWEYACRAGSKDDWGKRANGACGPLDAMGWYKENSGGKTHPVAQKEPNAWGLYDMHGNVREWCQDVEYWSGDRCRVYRGGSWDDDAWRCRAWDRNFCHPCPTFEFGFRLAAPLD